MNINAPITNSACNEVLEWKKRLSSYDNKYHQEENPPKRPRYQYYYVLESESSMSSDERSESIYSIQDKETDLAADTSDTDTKSDVSDSYDMQVEFEIASSCNEERYFEEDTSGDGNDAMVVAGAVAASIIEGSEIWATEGEDDSDSVSTFVSQTRSSETQMCRVCKIRETFSFFTICTHCYQIRKNLYPPRPRRPRHKKHQTLSQASTVTTDNLRSCLSGLSQDSGMGSSQEKLQPLAWDKIIVPQGLIQAEGGVETNEPIAGSSDTLPSTRSDVCQDTITEWTKATQELCIMCNEMPKDGIFVHSTGGHLCCCYKCAIKFYGKSRRCAACNCRALNVVKAFVI